MDYFTLQVKRPAAQRRHSLTVCASPWDNIQLLVANPSGSKVTRWEGYKFRHVGSSDFGKFVATDTKLGAQIVLDERYPMTYHSRRCGVRCACSARASILHTCPGFNTRVNGKWLTAGSQVGWGVVQG